MKDGTDRSVSIRPIGSWLLRLLASMRVVMAILSCQTPIALDADGGGWTPVGGERGFVLAYPDTHTQYSTPPIRARTAWGKTSDFHSHRR
jgi:hypothetical protein